MPQNTPENSAKTEFIKYYTKLGYVKLFSNIRGRFYTNLKNPRIVSAGCGPAGSSDFLGYRTITITEDMVGKPFAQFCAIEVKRFDDPKKARSTVEQVNFVEMVRRDGGAAGIISSIDESKRILEQDSAFPTDP